MTLLLRERVSCALASAIVAAVRRTGQPVGVVLLYHRVGDPEGTPAVELVPRMRTARFAEQVGWAARHFRIVPAAEFPDEVTARLRCDRIPLAITFDDDIPEHLRFAVPVLADSGVPATFFLCGHALDAPRAQWWERLQRAAERGLLVTSLLGTPVEELARRAGSVPEAIHELAAAIESVRPEERDVISAALLRTLGGDPPDAGMRADDVAMLADLGHDVGFHTRRHDRLDLLDDDQLQHAMRTGVDVLREKVGRRPTALAYPHGGADPRVAAAARDAGWRTAFTTDRRAVARQDDRMMLPRLEPGPVQPGEFALEVGRALAAAAWRSRSQSGATGAGRTRPASRRSQRS